MTVLNRNVILFAIVGYLYVQVALLFYFILHTEIDPNFIGDAYTYFNYGKGIYLEDWDVSEKRNIGVYYLNYFYYLLFGEASFYLSRVINIFLSIYLYRLIFLKDEQVLLYKHTIVYVAYILSPAMIYHANINSKEIIVAVFCILFFILFSEKKYFSSFLALLGIYAFKIYMPVLIVLAIILAKVNYRDRTQLTAVIFIAVIFTWFADIILAENFKFLISHFKDLYNSGGSSLESLFPVETNFYKWLLQAPQRIVVFSLSPVILDSYTKILVFIFNLVIFVYPTFLLFKYRSYVLQEKRIRILLFFFLVILIFYGSIAANEGLIWRQKILLSSVAIYIISRLGLYPRFQTK